MAHRSTLFLGIGLVLVCLAAHAPLGHAQDKSQEELRRPLIGTWRLVSWDGVTPESQNVFGAHPGAHPTGILMYDAHGLMSVQIMADRPRPMWPSSGPTDDVRLELARGYLAYWGTYTIDETAQTVTHHRQGKLDGDVVDSVRGFELLDSGNRLTLMTRRGQNLTWERVR